MKLLHTADLHLGRFLENRSRMDEQKQVLQEIVDIARAEQADAALLSGDIFDSFIPPARAEELFYRFVLDLCDEGRRPVILIAGNHDQPQRLTAAAPLAAARNIHIIGQPQTLIVHTAVGERLDIAALPYLSEARLGELFLSDISDGQAMAVDHQRRLAAAATRLCEQMPADSYHVLLAHLFIMGGAGSDSERPLARAMTVGGSMGVAADVFPAGLDYIALGHLHRPQRLNIGVACHYAGSPLAYSFSEADQRKSVVIAELRRDDAGNKSCEARLIPLTSGYPLTVYEALSYKEALAWCEDKANHGCWAELRIRVEQPLAASEIDALRQAHPRLSVIDPVYPQLEAVSGPEPGEQVDIAESFRRFVRHSEGVDCDDKLLAAFLQLAAGEEDSL